VCVRDAAWKEACTRGLICVCMRVRIYPCVCVCDCLFVYGNVCVCVEGGLQGLHQGLDLRMHACVDVSVCVCVCDCLSVCGNVHAPVYASVRVYVCV